MAAKAAAEKTDKAPPLRAPAPPELMTKPRDAALTPVPAQAPRKPSVVSNSLAAADRIEPTPSAAEAPAQKAAAAPAKKKADKADVEAKEVPHAGAGAAAPARGKRAAEPGEKEKAAQPQVDRSGESQVLASLAMTPASKLGVALDRAVQAAPAMHAREKQAMQASFPEIDRPTGIPRAPEKPGPREGIRPAQKEEELPAPESREASGEVLASYPETRAPLPAESTPIPDEEPAADDGGGSWWSGIFDLLRNFFSQLPSNDPNVSTSAGERPNVDQTGEANPALCKTTEGSVNMQVGAERLRADAATYADFGESSIYPDVPKERLRPSIKPRPVEAPRGKVGAPPGDLPADAQAAFDQALAPKVATEVGTQMDEHARARAEHDEQSADIQQEGKRQLDEATKEARSRQLEAKGEARREVGEAREDWRAEHEKVVQKTSSELTRQRVDHETKVDETVKQHEKDADTKLDEAEKDAAAKKKAAEDEAAEIKRREEARPKSWWERAKGAIKSVFNKIKGLVNAVFNKLRAAVKAVIDAAKSVVKGIIELGRRLVVGLIKTFGAIAKGLLTLALFAFPEQAKKARAWIDDKVDVATKAVNDAAEWLKNKADAILDWVGGMLDKILAFVQTLYNLYLDVLCMLATGEIWTLWKKVRDLGKAAKLGVTDHLEGEIWKELLGFDLTKDLGPQLAAEEAKEGGAPPPLDSKEAEGGDPANLAFLMQDRIRDDQVAVEPAIVEEVDESFTPFDPGASTITLASFADPERSSDAAVGELMSSLPQTSVPTSEEKEAQQQAQVDPEMGPIMEKLQNAHTRADRFDAVKDLMAAGLKRFWREKLKPNLWWIIPSLIVAIAAVILSGGAALAAIFEVLVVLFLAYDISKVMGGLKDYLDRGWNGDVPGAAVGFARGVAAGVVAALMFFLFEVGGRAIKLAFKGAVKAARLGVGAAKAIGKGVVRVGAAAAKGIVRGVVTIGRYAVRVAHVVAELFPKSGRFVLKQGRMIFRGIERGAAKVAGSIENFTKRLKDWFHRFKGFIAKPRSGGWLDIFGVLNPEEIYIGSIKIGGRTFEGPKGKEELEKALKAIKESGESLDDATRKEFQSLAEDLRKALDTGTFKGKLKTDLTKRFNDLFERFGPQHFETNPVLKEVWGRVLKNAGKTPEDIAKMTKEELLRFYRSSRGEINAELSGVVDEIAKAMGPLENAVRQLPPNVQAHHLLYKSLFPKLAVEGKNLVLALRKVSGGLDELHDLWHLVSSAGENRFRNLVDEVAEMIKSAAKL